MRTWNSEQARTRFDEILESCIREPQMICKGEKPAGVLIDMALFDELMRLRHPRPAITELLDELGEIKKHEPADMEIPERSDRTIRQRECP